MQRSVNRTIRHELTDIVHKHLKAVSEYLPIQLPSTNPPADILACLERLLDISLIPTAELDDETLEDACSCQTRVEDFLRLMNPQADPAFDQSEICRILRQTRTLCQSSAGQSLPPSISQVWDLLSPVKPDHLEALENGLYEARWWSPIPWMDVYLLRHTEGVMIYDENQNPKTLPDGICIRFSLAPSCSFSNRDS